MKFFDKLNNAIDEMFTNIFVHYLPTTTAVALLLFIGLPIGLAFWPRSVPHTAPVSTRCTVTLTTEPDSGVVIERTCTVFEESP